MQFLPHDQVIHYQICGTVLLTSLVLLENSKQRHTYLAKTYILSSSGLFLGQLCTSVSYVFWQYFLDAFFDTGIHTWSACCSWLSCTPGCSWYFMSGLESLFPVFLGLLSLIFTPDLKSQCPLFIVLLLSSSLIRQPARLAPTFSLSCCLLFLQLAAS